MRHSRRQRRVAPRGDERLFRQRGGVIRVDDVVREARMVGHLGEQRLENLRRLPLLGVSLVGGHSRLRDRQRIENAQLDILRVLVGDLLHGRLVLHHPIPLRRRLGAAVENGDGLDQRPLARRRRACRARLRHRRRSRLDDLGGANTGERVPPLAHRYAPIRHSTSGILLRDALEHLRRFRIPERVQQRDRFVEVVAHRRRARVVELHARAANPVGRGAVSFMLRPGYSRKQQRTQSQ